MEFVSIGGLLPGLTVEDIRSGISQPRNKNLAEVFHRLKLIEAYGTGIRRIYKLYENRSVQPRIEVTPNTFKMILPNRSVAAPALKNTYLPPQKEQILTFISRNGQITQCGANCCGRNQSHGNRHTRRNCHEYSEFLIQNGAVRNRSPSSPSKRLSKRNS